MSDQIVDGTTVEAASDGSTQNRNTGRAAGPTRRTLEATIRKSTGRKATEARGQGATRLQGSQESSKGDNGERLTGTGREAAAGEVAVMRAMLQSVATVLQHDRHRAAAYSLVAELAVRFSCERVSLGVVRRGRVRLYAVSHATRFDRRTNLVRAIESAMNEVWDQGGTLVVGREAVPGGTGGAKAATGAVPLGEAGKADSPSAVAESFTRITREHEGLRRQYGLSGVCSITLLGSGEVQGVLTLERATEPFRAREVTACETAVALVGPFLSAQKRAERHWVSAMASSFASIVRRTFGAGHLRWKLGVFLLGFVGAALILARGPYRMNARTVLEGSVRRVATAPFGGYVESAPLRAGDLVSGGDVICTLDQRDLRLELAKWESERDQLVKSHRQALARLDTASLAVLRAKIDQVQSRIEQAQERLARSTIRAPIDGVIVQGDLSQSIGAPVERGDGLFEIAPLDDYRVVIEVAEEDIAEFRVGQTGRLLLSALPTDSLPIVVSQVTPVSIERDGRTFFRAEARIEGPIDERLRPGMEGVAKIELGERHYVAQWTRGARQWFRRTFWTMAP